MCPSGTSSCLRVEARLTYNDVTRLQPRPVGWRALGDLRDQDASADRRKGCISSLELLRLHRIQLEHLDADVGLHHTPMHLQLQPTRNVVGPCIRYRRIGPLRVRLLGLEMCSTMMPGE